MRDPATLQYVGIVVVLGCVAYLNKVFQALFGLVNKKSAAGATA